MRYAILALDLGTTTGWALSDPDFQLRCGSKRLASPKAIKTFKRAFPAWDPRPHALFHCLLPWWEQWTKSQPVEKALIVYEDVKFSVSLAQTHLWASLRTTIWLLPGITAEQIDACPTGTLKKHATGSGAADKDRMRAAFLSRCPDQTELDDNAIDAWFLLDWSIQKHLPKP